MHNFIFYVPESHLEIVKQAVFAAGAGRYKNYDQCCWQTKGQGQFRPLSGSNPHVGSVDQVETITEYKVELICEAQYLETVIAAVRKSHPYEEPAFQYWPIKID